MYGLDHALDAVEEALELNEDDTNALYNKMAENMNTRLIVIEE